MSNFLLVHRSTGILILLSMSYSASRTCEYRLLSPHFLTFMHFTLLRKRIKPIVQLHALTAVGTLLQYASWGPRGSQLVMVQDGNIFYKDCAECDAHQITDTRDYNAILNGIPDWLYEEEILSKARCNLVFSKWYKVLLCIIQRFGCGCRQLSRIRHHRPAQLALLPCSLP